MNARVLDCGVAGGVAVVVGWEPATGLLGRYGLHLDAGHLYCDVKVWYARGVMVGVVDVCSRR